MNAYEGTRRVWFGDACFVPVCEVCGRFVVPHAVIRFNEATGLKDEPNAECSKCGPTKMLFEGFMEGAPEEGKEWKP